MGLFDGIDVRLSGMVRTAWRSTKKVMESVFVAQVHYRVPKFLIVIFFHVHPGWSRPAHDPYDHDNSCLGPSAQNFEKS